MTSNERHSNSTRSCVNIQNGEEIFNIVREVVEGVSRKKLRKGHMEQNSRVTSCPLDLCKCLVLLFLQ